MGCTTSSTGENNTTSTKRLQLPFFKLPDVVVKGEKKTKTTFERKWIRKCINESIYLKSAVERWSEPEIDRLIDCFFWEEIDVGTKLTCVGEKSRDCYILSRGVAYVKDASEKIVETKKTGDVIGDYGFFNRTRRVETCFGTTKINVYRLTIKSYEGLLEHVLYVMDRIPMFAMSTDEDRAALMPFCSVVKFKNDGEVVIEKGSECNVFYVLFRGKAFIGSRPVKIFDYFGGTPMLKLFKQRPYVDDVVANRGCFLLAINEDGFNHPAFDEIREDLVKESGQHAIFSLPGNNNSGVSRSRSTLDVARCRSLEAQSSDVDTRIPEPLMDITAGNTEAECALM